jgi:hypothetical protein
MTTPGTTRIVGVTNLFSHLSDRVFPKRELLYFDHVVVVGLADGIEALRQSGKNRYAAYAANLEWLVARGLLSEHDPEAHPLTAAAAAELERANSAARKAADLWERQQHLLQNAKARQAAYQLAHDRIWSSFDSNAYSARAAAVQLTSATTDAVALISPSSMLSTGGLTPGDVIEMILGDIPIPADSIPFEEVISFQAAPETRGHIVALRRWSRQIAKATVGAVEAAQEIEHLTREYQRHMEAQKLKYERGILEVAVVTAADMIESAMKLKLKSLAESMFKIRRARADLLEAEAKAPGREIAFLIRAHALVARTARPS